MSGNTLTWPINLEQPPQIRFGAVMGGRFKGVMRFRLPGLWAVHFYGYRATLKQGEHVLQITPGTVTVTPPGLEVEYRWPRVSSHDGMHLSLPPPRGVAGANIAALLAPGREFTSLRQRFIHAIQYLRSNPARAQACAWELLWDLASYQAASSPRALHPALRQAIEWIETKLAEPIRIGALARQLDLSHNHLTRLFRQAMGLTVRQYIQGRRVAQAQHLLECSTRSIKSIAVEVGIANLQTFNKLVRRELSHSPRQIRWLSQQRRAEAKP